MTTDLLTDVIPGIARFDNDTVTIGTYADGGDVHLSFRDGFNFRHIVVTGGSGSGKTILLESMFAGAKAGGIPAWMIAHNRDASAVIADYMDVAREGRDNVRDPRLLLVDGLTELTDAEIEFLTKLARFARLANTVFVVAAQDVRMGARAGSVLQHLQDPIVINFDGDEPGVGIANGDLFRTWYPGA